MSNHGRVHPHATLSISLLVSLVLWLPSLQACLAGELDLLAAALRYAAALVLARVAIGGMTHLWSSYQSAMLAAAAAKAAKEAENAGV